MKKILLLHELDHRDRSRVGGKGFVLLTGDVASVEAAVAAGAAVAGEEGILVGQAVIAAPSKDLFLEYV